MEDFIIILLDKHFNLTGSSTVRRTVICLQILLKGFSRNNGNGIVYIEMLYSSESHGINHTFLRIITNSRSLSIFLLSRCLELTSRVINMKRC